MMLTEPYSVSFMVRRSPLSRDGHDRLVERRATVGAVVGGITVGEDASVRGGQPVPVAGRRGRDPHDRLVERCATVGPEVPGAGAVGEDAAVGGDQPVPISGGCGRDPHDGLVERGTTVGAE